MRVTHTLHAFGVLAGALVFGAALAACGGGSAPSAARQASPPTPPAATAAAASGASSPTAATAAGGPLWQRIKSCDAASPAEIEQALGQAATDPVGQAIVGSECEWTLAKGGRLHVVIGPLGSAADFTPNQDKTHPWQAVSGLGQQAAYADEKSGAMLDQAHRFLYVMIGGQGGGEAVQLLVEVNQAAPDRLPGQAGLVNLARLIVARLTAS
jgi:hypothetical protein